MSKNDKIVKITDAVPPVVEAKRCIHITFKYPVRIDAEEALQARGLPVREHFDGPIFEDIAGHQVGSDWVAVHLKDNTSYVYPTSSIARMKIFIKE